MKTTRSNLTLAARTIAIVLALIFNLNPWTLGTAQANPSYPEWTGQPTVQHFAGTFTHATSLKVYHDGGTTFMLITAAAGGGIGGEDIYRSDFDGMNWGPPFILPNFSTAQNDWGTEIDFLGSKIYVSTSQGGAVRACTWSGAPNCGIQNGTAATNPRDIILDSANNVMYYSHSSGGVRRYHTDVNPWTPEVVPSLALSIVQGMYFGPTYALVTDQCQGGFICGIGPGEAYTYIYLDTGAMQPLNTRWQIVPGSNLLIPHPEPANIRGVTIDSKTGDLWYVALDTNDQNPVIYSVEPACGDQYCLGSDDCAGDCCPVLACNGQGCAAYNAAHPCIVCAPNCVGKTCGDDGCGGSCGPACPIGQTCDVTGNCVCAPDCGGKACGAGDGCGGSCNAGSCPPGQTCNAGICACVPDCNGKTCGDNGCGGSCGTCNAFPNSGCSMGNCICVADTCLNLAYTCGPIANDGCGGNVPSCGSCDPGYSCINHDCIHTGTCGDGICDNVETCAGCPLDCNLSLPGNVTLGGSCNLKFCDNAQPWEVQNVPGEVCTVTVDIRGIGPPFAQMTIEDFCLGGICGASKLACLANGSDCKIVYGNISVHDNGQHVAIVPTGGGVITGIEGTNYALALYTKVIGGINSVVFEASCSSGEVWYRFNTFVPPLEVHLGPVTADCPECVDDVKVNMTEKTEIIPDPPDGGDGDGGEVDAGDTDDAGHPDGDSGISDGGDNQGGDGSSVDGSGNGDSSSGDPNNGDQGQGGGGCSCSLADGHSNNSHFLLLGIILAVVYVRKRKHA